MELIFTWIENYKDILINQNLNFSYKFKINYNSEKNELLINDNRSFIADFFSLEKDSKIHISNITAIIGENGAGKTTTLEYISNCLTEGLSGLGKTNNIAIFYKVNVLRIYCQKEINIINKSEKCSYELNKIINNRISKHTVEELQDISFIYFSNIFDGKREYQNNLEYDNRNFKSISTNQLIYQDYEDFKNPNYEKENASQDNSELVSGTHPVIAHNKYEFKRQIFYFINKYDNYCDIKYPEEVVITVKEININSIFPKSKRNINNRNYNTLKTVNEFFDEYRNNIKENKQPLIKIIFYKSIFFNFINNILESTLFSSLFGNVNFIINDKLSPIKNIESFFKKITKEIPGIDEKTGIRKMIKNNIEFIKLFERLVNKADTRIFGNIIYFNTNVEKLEILKNFIDKYLETYPKLDFFEFSWRDLSSGEKAILNLYSRFYEIINKKVNKPTLKVSDSIIIMIDEGDIYLHPQWQKMFIKNILKFLTNLFESKFKNIDIQLIITSHSPIVLSDLPSDCVIFLSKNENDEIIQSNLDDFRQTFASNIYSLYQDSFFVKGGLIGDFSKEQIDGLLRILSNEDFINSSEERNNEIKNRIKIIGEPIIRNKLLTLFNEKINLDMVSIYKRLDNLEKSRNK
ncbi:MAG: hypothetical protein EHM58_00055 [Ignavibacteriae bacterium]|nr:MAG: hypothetical protein EHM58_00055 [Ignavibacteriota bacterium]